MVVEESEPAVERTSSFTDRVIDAFVSVLQGHSFQRPEALRTQLQGLEGYFVKASQLEKEQPALCRELRQQFPSGSRAHFNFLNELLKKSLGVQFHYNNKDNTFTSAKKSVPLVPTRVPIVDLLRLAEQYEPPAVRFDPAFSASIGDGGQESPTTIQLRASFVSNPFSVVFDSRFEKTKVCTKNKNDHSLATYQDAADPFSHRLRVEPEVKRQARTVAEQGSEINNASEDITHSVLEAELFECEGNSILVEGVYGDLPENQKEPIFDYLYACLIKYAYETGNSLQFNLSFNPRSQTEPIKFINHVSQRLHGRTLYVLDGGEYHAAKEAGPFIQESQRQLRAVTFRSSEAKKVRKRVAKNLEGIINESDTFFDAFSHERRYADSWQPYEFNVRKNHDKPQWNLREGEVSCLEIDSHQLKKEYARLFGKRRIPLVEKVLLGAVSVLATGALALWWGYSRPTICENGIVDRLTLLCTTEDGLEKEFHVETLNDVDITGSAITANVDQETYSIKLYNEGEMKSFVRAMERKKKYEKLIVGTKDKKPWPPPFVPLPVYQPIKKSYVSWLVEHSAPLPLLMRLDEFIDLYDLEYGSIPKKIGEHYEHYPANMLVHHILNAGLSATGPEEILPIFDRFSAQDVLNLVSSLPFSIPPGGIDFLIDMFGKKNHKIHDYALNLIDYYFNSGGFVTDAGVKYANVSIGNFVAKQLSTAAQVMDEPSFLSLLRFSYNIRHVDYAPDILEKLVGNINKARDHNRDASPYIAHVADTLNDYSNTSYLLQVTQSMFGFLQRGGAWACSSTNNKNERFRDPYYADLFCFSELLRVTCIQQGLETSWYLNDYDKIPNPYDVGNDDDIACPSIYSYGDILCNFSKTILPFRHYCETKSMFGERTNSFVGGEVTDPEAIVTIFGLCPTSGYVRPLVFINYPVDY